MIQKSLFYLPQHKPFKNDKKCSLFYQKSSFRFEEIYMFVLTFLIMRENSWIRKLRLISKFMTPVTGKKIITIDISPNISRRQGNQSMKFGQLLKCNVTNIFL